MKRKMNDFKKLQSILNQEPDYKFDPNGSYTGKCPNGETPVQDVDDL
ncbi:MAG: hypothetical protein R3Y32_04185 [Bacillota bacterium]